jgi:hypothetical protein
MQLESIIKSFTPAGVIGEWLEKGYIRLSEKNNAYYYTEAGYNDAVQETLKTTLETASGRGLGKPKPKVKLGVKPAIVTRETMKEFGFR